MTTRSCVWLVGTATQQNRLLRALLRLLGWAGVVVSWHALAAQLTAFSVLAGLVGTMSHAHKCSTQRVLQALCGNSSITSVLWSVHTACCDVLKATPNHQCTSYYCILAGAVV